MFQQNVLQGPGTGTFTSHTAEIIIMLLGAFFIGLWMGWVLWSRYRQAAERLRIDNESLTATVTALRTEVDTLKNKLSELESDRNAIAAQLQNQSWEIDNARGQLAILESDLDKVKERNRQLETELGMAMEPDEAGNAVSVEIAAPLSNEPDEELPDLDPAIADAMDAEIYAAANDLNPEMPEESAISGTATTEDDRAAAGHEEKDIPKVTAPAGAESIVPAPETPVEPVVTAVFSGPNDDLKIVEGIGPKIEELLFKAGVTTYGQLAATSVQQLKNILVDAGPRFAMHDPGTWSAQALLAANGEWENLKAYQDFLNAGKRPDK